MKVWWHNHATLKIRLVIKSWSLLYDECLLFLSLMLTGEGLGNSLKPISTLENNMNGYIQPNLFTKKRLLYGIMVQHISLKLSWNKKIEILVHLTFKTICTLYLYSCISYFSHFFKFYFPKTRTQRWRYYKQGSNEGRGKTSVEFVKWCRILAM